MTISEKLEHKDANSIQLFKEGVFWVAYEHSAYYVWLQKGYKANKKYVKAIKSDVLSLGFPSSALESLITGCQLVPADEKSDSLNVRTFRLQEAIDMDAYTQWRVEIPLQEKSPKIPKSAVSPETDVLEKLRQFQLINKTPMECMLFLSAIKSQVDSHQ